MEMSNAMQHVLVYGIVLLAVVGSVLMYVRRRRSGGGGCGCGSDGCSHGSRRPRADVKSQVKVFHVSGMRCATCEESIRCSLLELDDVVEVRASCQQKAVTVRFYSGDRCAETISARLNEMGYPVLTPPDGGVLQGGKNDGNRYGKGGHSAA